MNEYEKKYIIILKWNVWCCYCRLSNGNMMTFVKKIISQLLAKVTSISRRKTIFSIHLLKIVFGLFVFYSKFFVQSYCGVQPREMFNWIQSDYDCTEYCCHSYVKMEICTLFVMNEPNQATVFDLKTSSKTIFKWFYLFHLQNWYIFYLAVKFSKVLLYTL